MIEKQEYQSHDLHGREVDMCEAIEMNYGSDTYICDAISEAADSHVHVYNADLWHNAWNMKEYIEEAMNEGLVDPSSRDFTLERAFMAGEYHYLTGVAYDNIHRIVFNYAVEYIDRTFPVINFDVDDLECELLLIDNNNTFGDIENEVDDFMQDILEAGEVEQLWA